MARLLLLRVDRLCDGRSRSWRCRPVSGHRAGSTSRDRQALCGAGPKGTGPGKENVRQNRAGSGNAPRQNGSGTAIMTSFTDFLNERTAAGGFTTADALASFLPLVHQVVAAHQAGLVAPLEGVRELHLDKNRLWFEEAKLRAPVLAVAKVRELERPSARALEIMGQYRVDMHVEHGTESVVSVQIGRRGEPLTQAIYLPGYVSREHEVGHHDALTDIFVLGLVLASLTCGLDLNDPEDLTLFVQQRRNLFDLNRQLHPVLAKAIWRMTELNRHRRPQEASALLRTLENYRDQEVDFDFDLTRLPSFESADRRGRRALILSCLQQRLFEISRRNRLLHFRATTQTVNLTWASVPLA